MKKILVLEDNPATLMQLVSIIQEVDREKKIYSINNVKDAYQCAMETIIDLFVIDIILDKSKPGDSSGLRFVESIRKIRHYSFAPVIFVTSLEDARLYTYENLHCYSFIEKPFDAGRMKQLVEQCLCFEESRNIAKTLYFRKDGIILAVEREDIVYAESINHIINIHTKNGDVLSIPYNTLKRLLADLDSIDFIQCSRSTIINKKYVQNVDITNRVIQFRNNLGRTEIGVMYKKNMKESFR